MTKTLYLEKRGCDFFNGDEINSKSDVTNYRVGSYDYSIKGYDGNNYILEFTHGDKRRYRKVDYRTHKVLKHPVYEVTNNNALFLDTQFENEKGCWRNSQLEHRVWTMDFSFTLDNILAVVNLISVDKYDKIEFVQ